MDANIKSVNAYPLIKHYIGQLELMSTFKAHIPKGQSFVDPAEALCIMITNILFASKPLYQVEEWLADYADYHGEEPAAADLFNDDRLARSLDKLFAAPRQEMLTEISLKAIQTYELETNCIHNDSTTVTFTGEYRNQSQDTVQMIPGYNKDHRPDLKQIVFGLNITEDGHVPIDHQIFDGNRTDDTTHIDNWERLRDFLHKEDFIYIADSKLSTKKNLTAIDGWGGKFISILPRTRKEVTEFYEKLRKSYPDLELAYQKESSRKKGEFTVYRIYDNTQTREGFRLIWVHSSAKEKQDAGRRQSKIERTQKELSELASKLNTYRLKTKEQIQSALDSTLKKNARFFTIDLREIKTTQKVQIGRGRPSANTKYREIVHLTYDLDFERNQKEIIADSTKDGFFPLVTNLDLEAKEVLKTYKNQPYLEKRFNTLKSVTEVAPIYLKTPKRIEAMLFLYFIALMIISLMERNIRKAMNEQSIESLKIRPNRMKTTRPTWNNIRYYFRNILLIVVTHQGEIDFTTKGLNKTHALVSRLLGVPTGIWYDLSENFWRFDSG